jgi:hypothetical protein
MNKIKVSIALSFIIMLFGMLLGIKILIRFIPVLGGDSVIPESMAILSRFSTWDYLQICLSIGFLSFGLFILLLEIVLLSKGKRKMRGIKGVRYNKKW